MRQKSASTVSGSKYCKEQDPSIRSRRSNEQALLVLQLAYWYNTGRASSSSLEPTNETTNKRTNQPPTNTIQYDTITIGLHSHGGKGVLLVIKIAAYNYDFDEKKL